MILFGKYSLTLRAYVRFLRGVSLVSILFILVALFLPVFGQERGSRRIPAVTNLRFLALGLDMYVEDNDGFLPPLHNSREMKRALWDYTVLTESPPGKHVSALTDRLTLEPYPSNPFLSGKKRADLKSQEAWLVAFYEPRPDKWERRWVVMLNGQVQCIKESEWPRVKKASHISASVSSSL